MHYHHSPSYLCIYIILFLTNSTSQEGSSWDANEKKEPVINFPMVNRTDIEKTCKKLSLGKCWSSDKLLPVCASNKIVYKNPGVLIFAQVCSPGIELEAFCDAPGGPDSEDPKKQCSKCPDIIDKAQDPDSGGEAVDIPPEYDDADSTTAAQGVDSTTKIASGDGGDAGGASSTSTDSPAS